MQLFGLMETTTPASRSPIACTCSRIRKAARRVSLIYDQALQPFGLTVSQFGILANLRSMDGASIGELAERMVMDPTSLTRTLKPLLRDGFIHQQTDPNDRRARRLGLTAEGLAKLREAKAGWAVAQASVEAALGAAETAALNETLDRTLERLDVR